MTTKRNEHEQHELAKLPMMRKAEDVGTDTKPQPAANVPDYKIGDSLRFVPMTPEEIEARKTADAEAMRAQRWQARFNETKATGEMPGLERDDIRGITDIAFAKLKRKHRDKYDDDTLLSAAFAYGTVIAEEAAAKRRH